MPVISRGDTMACAWAKRRTSQRRSSLCEKDEQQRHHSRHRLNEQDRPLRREAADDPGDDDTRQEKDPDGEHALARRQETPDETCRQKRVVETLIDGQTLRAFRDVRGESEDSPSEWPGPEKRFEDEEHDVKKRDERDGDQREQTE